MERFETFVSDITELYRVIQQLKNLESARLGLEGRHVMFLNYLRANPEGVTAAELCRLCGEDKAAISRTAADLEKRQLIVREKGYRARISLTEEGAAAADSLKGLSDKIVEIGGADLSDHERQVLYSTLAKITENLISYCRKAEQEV